jgi:hypothetical protein
MSRRADLGDRMRAVADLLPVEEPDLPEIARRAQARRRRRVGGGVLAVAASAGLLAWSAIALLPILDRTEPSSPVKVNRFQLPGPAQLIAADGGVAWTIVQEPSGAALFRVEAASGEVREVDLGATPISIAADHGEVWAGACEAFPPRSGDCRSGVLVRIDPATSEVEARIEIQGEPRTVILAQDDVLVVELAPEARRLLQVDGVGNVRTVVDDEDGDFGWYPVGFVGDHLWGYDSGGGRAVQIELSDGTVSRSIPFEDPCQFGLGGADMWVASCGGRIDQPDELARIDLETGKIVVRASLQGSPRLFRTDEGAWLVGQTHDRSLWVQRVGSLTARPAGTRIRIDIPPAGIRFPALHGWMFGGFTDSDGDAFWLTWPETGEVIRVEPGKPRTADWLPYRDAELGWSLSHPPGYTADPFDVSTRLDIRGVTISNFGLSVVPFNEGMDPLRSFPASGVAFMVWTFEGGPMGPPPTSEASFPLDPSGFHRVDRIAGGAEPVPMHLSFGARGRPYSAAIWIGAEADPADRAAMMEVVRSLRFDPLVPGTIVGQFYVIGPASDFAHGSVNRIDETDLPREHGSFSERAAFFVVRGPGGFYGVSGLRLLPDQSECELEFDPDAFEFVCPVNGARWNHLGQLVHDPTGVFGDADRDLSILPTLVTDDGFLLVSPFWNVLEQAVEAWPPGTEP